MDVRMNAFLSSNEQFENDMRNEDDELTKLLPEGIRLQILSLLPTADSVRTTVLSKNWEHLWKYVPSLHFDDKLRYHQMGKRVHFIDFVYHVLMNSECKSLNSFHLSCSKHLDQRHAETWISTAIKREVKCLTIYYENENMVLPRCFLRCKSFKELEMKGPMTVKVPPRFLFPNLTSLNLTRIKFQNDEIAPKELILNFPAVRVLRFFNCMFYHVKIIKIYANALAHFMWSWSCYYCECCETKDCKVEVIGSNNFVARGYMLENVIISRPELVVDAEFGHYFDYRINAHLDLLRTSINRAVAMLSTFLNLTILKLTTDIIEATAREVPPIPFPLLDKVKWLMVYSGLQKISWCGALMRLLKSLPKLENLHFNLAADCWHADDVNQDVIFETPKCISSSLQVVGFERFDASASELRLVKLILKDGSALKQVSLVTSITNKRLLGNELLSVQTASNEASVMFKFFKGMKKRKGTSAVFNFLDS